jgi:hypothetical protein
VPSSNPTPDDPPRSRNIKLTDAEWAALERIARHHGFEWGGIPSRSEAVRKLVKDEIERSQPASTAGPYPASKASGLTG